MRIDTDDDVLALVLTCCHPAPALEAQVALTLSHVTGLAAREIAAAFLVPGWSPHRSSASTVPLPSAAPTVRTPAWLRWKRPCAIHGSPDTSRSTPPTPRSSRARAIPAAPAAWRRAADLADNPANARSS